MSSYWEERFLSIWLFNEHEDKRYLRQMDKRMETLQNSLSESMNDFIARWATQDGLSMDDMRALISKEDQRKWKMTLKEFRQKAIDGGYEEELNREYFRSRISRVEQLRGQLYLQGVEAAVIERQELETHLLNQKQETFFRTIYELSNRGQVDFGINWEKYNSNLLKRSLYTPWEGANFSQRVWGNLTKELPERLTNVLSQAAVSGWSIDKMQLELSRGITGVTKSRMTTLVQTESTHIAELAAFDGYRETNVEQWQWMATLEVNTCVHCASLDTQVFDVDGNQDPPPGGSHPNCRCRSIPYVEGWVHLKRWSRNPETGESEQVDFVSYEEWKQGKTGNTESGEDIANLKNLYNDAKGDRKVFAEKILDSIGINVPVEIKSIKAFGYNQFENFGKGQTANVSSFVLNKNDDRSSRYQAKTVLHETYHSRMQGLEVPISQSGKFTIKEWTAIEETMTETSAHYQMSFIDKEKLMPSYSNYLSVNLPRLQKIEGFEEATDFLDFGKIAMKYRFDDKYKTADWRDLHEKINAVEFDFNKYVRDNYVEELKSKKAAVLDMIYANSTSFKQHDEYIQKDYDNFIEKIVDGRTGFSGMEEMIGKQSVTALYRLVGVKKWK